MIYKKIKNRIKYHRHRIVEQIREDLLLKNISEFNEQNMTSIEKFIFNNYLYNVGGHFSHSYKEWTTRRLTKVLNIYGVDYFRNKKILILGDGIGYIGSFFAEIGAKVLSLEGRRGNVNLAKLKYNKLKNFKIKEFNLLNDFTHFGKFDLIINFGLIEVIEDVEHLLKCCCKMSDDILVETIVCDSIDKNDKFFTIRPVNKSNDFGLTEKGSFVSPFLIEDYFKKNGYNIVRYFDKDLNTDTHIYDWKHKNDKSGDKDVNKRRFWRFKKLF